MRSLVFATILLQGLQASTNASATTCSAEFPESCDDAEQAEDCNDYHDSCHIWAREGGCEQSYGYMRYHCPLSCGTCEEIEREDGTRRCSDDEYRCVEWAGLGECDENPAYMLTSCKRACLVCYDGTSQWGLEQRVPTEEEAGAGGVERTISQIEQSVQYMRRVWKDSDFAKVRHKCQNQHVDCTWWAAIGECEKNPKYMRVNCAPACESCDLLDIRHRCPIEPGNDAIWKPGDLNKLMEDVVDDASGTGEYKRFDPKALSRPSKKRDGTPVESAEETEDGPWVVLLDNFVSEAEADRMVELGKLQGYERSADVGKEKPDGTHDSLVSESRTSHNTWCQEKTCYEDKMIVPVVERIASVTQTMVNNSEYLQLLQYEPGQYYRQHHDYIPHHRGMPCGVRILTLFIYLNDVEEGGGTHFPLLDITVQPKKGSALLWPSVLDEAPESKDGRTDHEALPVIKGLKYGANAWIHSRNFKAAFEDNCH